MLYRFILYKSVFGPDAINLCNLQNTLFCVNISENHKVNEIFIQSFSQVIFKFVHLLFKRFPLIVISYHKFYIYKIIVLFNIINIICIALINIDITYIIIFITNIRHIINNTDITYIIIIISNITYIIIITTDITYIIFMDI